MSRGTVAVGGADMSRAAALSSYREILKRDPCSYCGALDVRLTWLDRLPVVIACPVATFFRSPSPFDPMIGNFIFRLTGSERDHILPKRDGGPDRWTNLTAACASCNQQKGTSSLLDFLVAGGMR